MYYTMLKHDAQRFVKEGNTRIYCVRVDATKAIAEMYGLKGYKRQNYVIQVI